MYVFSLTYTHIMTHTGEMREVEEALPHEAPSKRSQHRNRERIMSINTLRNATTLKHTHIHDLFRLRQREKTMPSKTGLLS